MLLSCCLLAALLPLEIRGRGGEGTAACYSGSRGEGCDPPVADAKGGDEASLLQATRGGHSGGSVVAADGRGCAEGGAWPCHGSGGGSGGGAKKPHILYILADDYGWGNFGPHRRGPCHPTDWECRQGKAEVNTPVLDELVDEGILLERHYSYKICGPSRNSLQSGRLGVHVNMVNAPATTMNRKDPISGYAGMPRNMTGMGQKMKDRGYRTHIVGKWDVGMATPQHTPQGRGYDTWMGYFLFANDYWTKGNTFTATGELDNCLNTFTDYFLTNETYRGGVRDDRLLFCPNTSRPEIDPLCYEEAAFKQRALDIIRNHNVRDKQHPLFLLYSSHLVHTPLQVPESYLKEIDVLVKKRGGKPFSSEHRRSYAAMTLYLDRAVGEMVAALKAKSMYEDTLIVFHADNGGPVYLPGSANNWPLKGSKYNDFEGGVRTNAFLSGGFVPKRNRGTKHHGIISIADWYGTLCVIGGGTEEECLSDPSAEEANSWIQEQNSLFPNNTLPLLPSVDSVVQWPFILNGSNGRPGPLHLTNASLLEWPYKLVIGVQPFSSYQGPLYPNCSTIKGLRDGQGPLESTLTVFDSEVPLYTSQQQLEQLEQQEDCGDGCLYNVEVDPTEHRDLAGCPKHAKILARMQAKLAFLSRDNFEPDRGTSALKACEVQFFNGGYYGPFHKIEGYYSPVEPVDDPAKKKEIEFAATPFGEQFTINRMEQISPLLLKQSEAQDDCLYCPN